jgi:HAD superfamily hydrolase (TIGR01484 family)
MMPQAVAGRVLAVLTDIDDTITTEGALPAAAYAAMERLHAAGFLVVPVTGRPAGWCDLIARFWPVDGVVGENGALYFRYDRRERRMLRRYALSGGERLRARRRLAALAGRILAAVPGAALASDQAYRECDLAIDYREDVRPLGPAAAQRIAEIARSAGAVAKISSIHVNVWFGRWDKLTMVRTLFREAFTRDLARIKNRVIFVGDSPNDAPMFAYFPHAVGVANLRAFAGRIEAEPAYLTRAPGGAGFVELARHLLRARR